MTTKPSRGQSITTGVFAVLQIITAIIVMVLLKVTVDSYFKIAASQSGVSLKSPPFESLWIFGLPFLVPGIFGVVAAFVKNACAYGLYMAACIIGCVVDAVFCLMGFAFLFSMAAAGGMDCMNVDGECLCSTGNVDLNNLQNSHVSIGINDCYDMNRIVHMSYGTSAMLIFGWVLCLAGSIISCASCCCGTREPTTVIMTTFPGQAAVTVNTSSSMTSYAPPAYAPAPPPAVEDDNNQYKYNRMY